MDCLLPFWSHSVKHACLADAACAVAHSWNDNELGCIFDVILPDSSQRRQQQQDFLTTRASSVTVHPPLRCTMIFGVLTSPTTCSLYGLMGLAVVAIQILRRS
ncbi:hypothetical protein HRR83_001069 [Exophiala dermatitidis]|uniref:Uncharacterized protein n=1 Tax=Exophiala dermatitidis TaxID=5970 RepID=A0AAN6F135_EXODE|nr:hypothetical protein HRR74_001073 [Exophiala dermatitidis]KAJ4527173.1 hypothetical protein HRR73_001970 [Exophiala dermatitidis]KAJ4532895.1 hypothetical protein HRR76_007871 [Exophiala dermatitidis]KAJ4538835.1 hypothetical protein HRR77_006760 [Exophiala dermatitidis]KAJ4574040.1 hypothetical protein HRR79_003043 [Exophiala dermatitidis]